MSISLHHIPTRQEAYEILSKMKVIDLLELAKTNRVFVHKRNKKAIIEKIIESTVGARLRSEAIKSISLK